MKKISYLLCVILFLGIMSSCKKNEEKGIEFQNKELENLVREFLGKSTGNLTEDDLLTIDSINGGINLSSLKDFDRLKNLVFLNIVDNVKIKEIEVEALQKKLNNCKILHRKYVLSENKYFLLNTIRVSKTKTSYPEYQYEIIMEGKLDNVMVEVNVYSRDISLVESTSVSDTYINRTTRDDHSFHPYWSVINVKDIINTDLYVNSTTKVIIKALSTGSLSLNVDGNIKVVYHTDNMK